MNLSTYYGTTALTYAIRCGNDEVVQLLLSRRDIDVNFQVRMASRAGWRQIDIPFTTFQSRDGENALIEAVTYRKYDIARTLAAR